MSPSEIFAASFAPVANHVLVAGIAMTTVVCQPAGSRPNRQATAIVYCGANFTFIDGKTANGLVRHSEKYRILSVIDSHQAGRDAGLVLDGMANRIPVCADLGSTLALTERMPEYFILGMAPASGALSPDERAIILEAIGLGMNIVNGLYKSDWFDPGSALWRRARSGALAILLGRIGSSNRRDLRGRTT